MAKDSTYYEILGIPGNSSQNDIQRAYENLSHQQDLDSSDHHNEIPLSAEVELAYEVLSNPEKRLEYDESLSDYPPAPELIDIDITYSRKSISNSKNSQLVYALLDFGLISDPARNTDQSLSRNIALILDSSTSMKGERLDIVKAAALDIVQHLNPGDILSVVQFSDRARVILPAGPRMDMNKTRQDIHMMAAGGGTEIYQGLLTGYNQLRKYLTGQYNSHIILITDGRTYGDEAACLSLAHRAALQGVTISGLGIGSEWNDPFIDDLARRTGGSSRYISDPQEIQKFLFEKFQDLENVVYPHASLDFQSVDNADITYSFRISPEPGNLPTTPPIQLGSLKQGQNQKILIEFTLESVDGDPQKIELLNGTLALTTPDSSITPYQAPITLELPVSNKSESDPPAEAIVQAMSKLTLYRLQERAKLDLEEGRVDEAARRFQNLATHLLARGEGELARTVLKEANNLQENKNLSNQGSKEIKYGTRNLIMPDETRMDE